MCVREIDGEAVEFGTTGYTMEHVFVIYDRATESIWYPMTDGTFDAVAGAQRGAALPFLAKPKPMPLEAWLAKHPKTAILLPSERDARMIRMRANRAYLGVRLDESAAHVEILEVTPESAAANAGLQTGDRIVRIDDHQIASLEDLRDVLGAHRPGDTIEVLIERDEEALTVEVELGRR